MSRENDAAIDPVLQTQLAESAEAQRSVAATFTLRTPSDKKFLAAPKTESTVQKVLERVTRETRSKPSDVTVFANIQSFAVCASPEFIEHLLRQPEIESATANEQPEDMHIRPITTEDQPAADVKGRKGKTRR